MQIVIKIPDNKYKWIKDNPLTYDNEYCEAIRKGTPLPKGHGKIGDLDRLYNVFEKNVVSADAFKELFNLAPTIIEADTEGSESE